MMQRVHRQFVAGVYRAHFFRARLHMWRGHAVLKNGIRVSQQPGIDIERGFEPVFVQYFYQPPVLRHAVVVAERQCFQFSAEIFHELPPDTFMILYASLRVNPNRSIVCFSASFGAAPPAVSPP